MKVKVEPRDLFDALIEQGEGVTSITLEKPMLLYFGDVPVALLDWSINVQLLTTQRVQYIFTAVSIAKETANPEVRNIMLNMARKLLEVGK